jgi:hypothetical protein
MNKILGYALLIVGLAMIIFSVYQSYNIFTAKVSAPLVFKTFLIQQKTNDNSTDLQTQLNNTVRDQINQIISQDNIIKTFNLISWSFMAGILIMAGGAIAGIGVKLMKA